MPTPAELHLDLMELIAPGGTPFPAGLASWAPTAGETSGHAQILWDTDYSTEWSLNFTWDLRDNQLQVKLGALNWPSNACSVILRDAEQSPLDRRTAREGTLLAFLPPDAPWSLLFEGHDEAPPRPSPLAILPLTRATKAPTNLGELVSMVAPEVSRQPQARAAGAGPAGAWKLTAPGSELSWRIEEIPEGFQLTFPASEGLTERAILLAVDSEGNEAASFPVEQVGHQFIAITTWGQLVAIKGAAQLNLLLVD